MTKLRLITAVLALCSLTTEGVAAPTTLDAQVAQGKKLYSSKCANCHGNAGQGTKKAPPVVGTDAFPLDPRKGQKRGVQFHTAADVFAWASKHMPPKKKALTTDEYLAIFAFDLTANGIKLDRPLDAAQALKIVLHP